MNSNSHSYDSVKRQVTIFDVSKYCNFVIFLFLRFKINLHTSLFIGNALSKRDWTPSTRFNRCLPIEPMIQLWCNQNNQFYFLVSLYMIRFFKRLYFIISTFRLFCFCSCIVVLPALCTLNITCIYLYSPIKIPAFGSLWQIYIISYLNLWEIPPFIKVIDYPTIRHSPPNGIWFHLIWYYVFCFQDARYSQHF